MGNLDGRVDGVAGIVRVEEQRVAVVGAGDRLERLALGVEQLDERVGESVESDPGFSGFYERLTGLVLPLLPRYLAEGKHYLTIAIGCTGGRHRSVYLAEQLAKHVRRKSGVEVFVRHLELENLGK